MKNLLVCHPDLTLLLLSPLRGQLGREFAPIEANPTEGIQATIPRVRRKSNDCGEERDTQSSIDLSLDRIAPIRAALAQDSKRTVLWRIRGSTSRPD